MNADPEQRPASCKEFIEDLTGKSTRKLPMPKAEIATQDLWYLLYKDEEGAAHLVKGSVNGIRRSLKEGLLGDASNVRASRTKTGAFEQLTQFAEFRDLVAKPPPDTPIPIRKAPSGPADSSEEKTKKPKKPTPVKTKLITGPHIPIETNKTLSIEWMRLIMIALGLGITAGIVAAIFLNR